MRTLVSQIVIPALHTESEALRVELRCLLQHPAITPARRLAAESFIGRCTEPHRLRHWLSLTVSECARWEEMTLAEEALLPVMG